MLLQYTSDFTQSFQLVRWMMGSLDTVGYSSVWGVAPVLVIGAIVLFIYARAFNLLALGDDAAQTAGVNVKRLELVGFIVAGLLAGAAVSQVGPIGFVGLIVPHTVRLMVGPDYRLVIPGSLLVGGGFLVLCDLLSRTVMAPVELPPGIITAILGAPFFLSLLRSKGREISV
jgi:iron complex transport system permease protein